jgi:hypothetical protein
VFKMAVGHSDDVDPTDAIRIAIEQCRTSLDGLRPQAGMLFAAFDSFDPSILGEVRRAFPGIAVVGTTSAAELSSVSGYQEDSIMLAIFASDSVDVTAGLGASLSDDVETACRAAAAEALAATTQAPKVCIVLTEGLMGDPQIALESLARVLPEGVAIVGGASARHDLSSATPGYQFSGDRVVQDGIALLLFSGPIAYSTAIGTGWRTIGATGTVTRSDPGAILEVDGRPATDFLARYLDVTGPASYGNPLAVVEAEGAGSYLRAIVGSAPVSGTVNLIGSVPVGATVQLTTADTDDILAGTSAALARASADFPTGSTPEAALLFSCAVRQFLLGSRTQEEARLARAGYGPSMPLAGMYCYGEIGPIEGTTTSRFFQESFVALLLGT